MQKTPETGVSIFYQTDIKKNGTWVDKSFLCQKAAASAGSELLWHKIVCRKGIDHITFGRPAYTHLLCFSKSLRVDLAKSTADVISECGEKVWERGMGLNACLSIAKFIAEQTTSHTIVAPFCGHGSMLAAAELFSLHGIGIELSKKRAKAAKKIRISEDRKKWAVTTDVK